MQANEIERSRYLSSLISSARHDQVGIKVIVFDLFFQIILFGEEVPG